MPQVRDKTLQDEWYVNQAKTADGTLRPLSLGTITFKPGQERFIHARARAESRSTNQAFEQALANGSLKTRDTVAPSPPPVVNRVQITETVAVVDEVLAQPVVIDTEPVVADGDEGHKKKRRTRE